MQNKLKLSNKYVSIGFKTLKLLLGLALLISLYFQVIIKFKDFDWNLFYKLTIFFGVNVFYWILMLALLVLNWALEAKKWQLLVSKLEDISFSQAFKGVLAGLAFSNILVSIGDFAGKILMLHTDKRFQSIGAALLGNLMQLYASLFFGLIGLVYFFYTQHPNPQSVYYLIIGVLATFVFLGLIIGIFFEKLHFLILEKRIIFDYIKVLKEYRSKDINRILGLSLLRYIVFSTQFYLVLLIFKVDLSWEILFSGVSLIFLGKTIGSLVNSLGDLSVRELSAVYFFSFYEVNLHLISLATFTVWIINVLFPSLVGSFYVLQLKFSTHQQQSE